MLDTNNFSSTLLPGLWNAMNFCRKVYHAPFMFSTRLSIWWSEKPGKPCKPWKARSGKTRKQWKPGKHMKPSKIYWVLSCLKWFQARRKDMLIGKHQHYKFWSIKIIIQIIYKCPQTPVGPNMFQFNPSKNPGKYVFTECISKSVSILVSFTKTY